MAKNPFLQLHVYRNASQKGKRVTDCYRLLYKEELWSRASTHFNRGQALQTVSVRQTLIRRAIEKLKAGTFRFNCGKEMNKEERANLQFEGEILQEVIRLILTKIYEPVFSHHVYGVRKTSTERDALIQIKKSWHTVTWCLKGNFLHLIDDINPYVLLKKIYRKVSDRRFLLLLHHILTSDTVINQSLSHIFGNIYLFELDSFIHEKLTEIQISHGKQTTIHYVRYHTEFVIGVNSSKNQALHLKNMIDMFVIKKLQLNHHHNHLSLFHIEKRISFLGYTFRKNIVIRKTSKEAVIRLEIPREVILQFIKKRGIGQFTVFEMTHRKNILHKTELEILEIYNNDLKRLAVYYQLADNFYDLNKLFFYMQSSFIKTLANKRRTSSKEVTKSLERPNKGRRLCLSKVGRDGRVIYVPFVKLTDFPKYNH